MITLQDVDLWISEKIIEFFNFQKLLSAEAEQRKNRKQDVFAVLNSKLKFWEKFGDNAELLPEEVQKEDIKKTEKKGIFKFNEKELNKMPKEIKEQLKKNFGKHVRQKSNGVYEIRMNYKGIPCYGSSKNFAEAERKFFESVKAALIASASPQAEAPAAPTQKRPAVFLVEDYAIHYLETFKKPNICDDAYKNYLSQVRNHIAPFFKDELMSDVTATQCQQLLNAVLDAGKGRLSEDLNSLLGWICEAAVADGILSANPMASVQIPKHFRKEGRQIPVEIMENYLAKPPLNRSDYCMWLMAFSGVRPCELKTIVFEDGFMTIKNAKQGKNQKPTFRRIPIHTALLPFLTEIKASITMSTDCLAQAFKRRFPKEYHLYELRHTFTSRIQECYANKSWVDYATNHTGNKNTTDKVYTHWSDTFQVSEMAKLHYRSQS